MDKKTKALKIIGFILTNISFILSAVMMVFIILDKYNPLMGFVDSPFSMTVLAILLVSVLLNSVLSIIRAYTSKNEK